MRLTTDRWWCVPLVAVALLGLAGCKDRSGTGTAGGVGGGGDAAGGPTARHAADAFLKELGDGKTTPDQLTSEFRQQIGPPVTDDEKKAGFSDSTARDWLARFKGATFVVGEESKLGDGIVLRGRAQVPGQAQAFALRVVKGSNGYLADWLHLAGIMGSEIKTPADPDLAAAQDVVRNFLDLVLGGDHRQVHVLMTPDWKKRLAPPTPADARKGFDYDPGFLTQSTRSWKREYVGYTLSKQELNAGKDGATFTAELEAGGQKTTYAVQATKDKATGRWLVAAFDKQS